MGTTQETRIGIATPPDGEIVMCPAVVVGRGLVVADLPAFSLDGRRRYSVTHIGTGYKLGDNFFSRALALRCAREMTRVQSFEETPDTSDTVAMAELAQRWVPAARPVMDMYEYLDDLWITRERYREMCREEAGQ